MTPKETFTILLVDDDDGQATLVERNLIRAGVANTCIRARDGQEALALLESVALKRTNGKGSSVVMLLDINMPRVDGIEVLRQAKANPRTAPIPIIMLTTTDDPDEVDRCYQLGCNLYITKPVQYDQFSESIRRLGQFLQTVKFPQANGHS